MSRSLLRGRNGRPRPSRNMASRTEVLPAPFSPEIRLSSGENSSAADSMHLRFSMRSSARDIGAEIPEVPAALEPHRHHNVFAVRGPGRPYQATAIAVGKSEQDRFGLD